MIAMNNDFSQVYYVVDYRAERTQTPKEDQVGE